MKQLDTAGNNSSSLQSNNFMKKIFTVLITVFALLNGANSQAQGIALLAQNFDTSTQFPPVGWLTNFLVTPTCCVVQMFQNCNGSCGTPGAGSAHSSPNCAWEYNYENEQPGVIMLMTPKINFQNYSLSAGTTQFSYWIYKYSGTYGTNSDVVSFWLNSTQDFSTHAGGLPAFLGRENEYTAPGSNCIGCHNVSGSGWYQYTYTIPQSFTTAPYYVIMVDTSEFGYDVYLDDIRVDYIPPCSPPSANPTNLHFTATSASQTTVAWNAAVSTPAVNDYLVVRSVGPLTGLPVNNSSYAPGALIGNGTVAYNNTGLSFTDVSLNPGTTYTYTIFPYVSNNLCSGIVYLATNPLNGSVTTGSQSIYTWTRLNGTIGDWTVPTNWTPTRTTPDPSDILEFENGLSDTATNVPNQTVKQLLISNNTTVHLRSTTAGGTALNFVNTSSTAPINQLLVDNLSNLIVDPAATPLSLTFAATNGGCNVLITGSLQYLNTGSISNINMSNCVMTVAPAGSLVCGGTISGTVFTNATPSNLIINGTYQHSYTTTAGPAIPSATWGPSSLVLINGYTNQGSTTTAYGPGGSALSTTGLNWSQSFANVTYNCPNQVSGVGGNITLLGGPRSVSGAFTMLSSGAGSVVLDTATLSYSDTVNNYLQSGGVLDLCGGASGNATHVLNISGGFTQTGGTIIASTTSPAPSVTLNFYGASFPTKTVLFNAAVKGPVTYRVSTPINLGFSSGGPLAANPVFNINHNGGIRISVTSTVPINPLSTALILRDSGNTTLTYDTTGNGFITKFLWPVATPPLNLTVSVGLGNTVKFPTLPTAAVIGGTLKFISGDVDLGNDSMVIGLNATTPGAINDTTLATITPVNLNNNPVINTNMGNIHLGPTGSLTRWFSTAAANQLTVSSGVNSAFYSANLTKTPGFFPVSFGALNRNVLMYFASNSVIQQGGTITVMHNPATGLITFPAVADGLYSVDKETNANWTVSIGNGFQLAPGSANTVSLKITAASLFAVNNPPNPNLRLMHYYTTVPTFPGTHVNSSGQAPIYNAERQGLAQSDLGSPFYIGANHVDISGVYTAINTGNWSVNSTWDANQPPSLIDNAVINPNVTVTIDKTTSALDTTSASRFTVNECKSLINYGTLNAVGVGNKVTIDTIFNNFGNILIGLTDTLVYNGNMNFAAFTTPPGIINNGALNMSGGIFKMGVGYGNDNFFNNFGSLTVSGGTWYLNGNLSIKANSVFSQSGGSIIVDGNAAGVIVKSVIGGTALVSFQSPLITLSGGSITVLDPHAQFNPPTNAFEYNSTTNITDAVAHTFIFGDTLNISSDANTTNLSANPIPVPFLLNPNRGSGMFTFGNIIIGGGAGPANNFNRWVSPSGSVLNVKGNMTVYNNGEYRMNQYPLYINGNLTVNSGGLFTADSTNYPNAASNSVYNYSNSNPAYPPAPNSGGAGPTVYFAQYNTVTPSTPLPATQFQQLNGSGFRNAALNQTAQLRGISVINSNSVQFNAGNLTFSGALTFKNAAGAPSRIYMSQGSTLTEYAYNPIASPTQLPATVVNAGTLNGWVVGGYSKHAYGLPASPQSFTNYIFPIGDSNYYTPVTLTANAATNIVTSTGDIQLRTTAGVPNITGSTFNPLAVVNRKWTLSNPNNNFKFTAGGIKATFQWAATDPDTGFHWQYARVGLDSPSGNPLFWSYPPPIGQTSLSVTGTQLGSGTGSATLTPKFVGDYTVADSCPTTVIWTQPQPYNGCLGGPAVFYDSAVGAGLTYQWQFNCSQNIPNATQNFLTIPSLGPSNVGNYRVIVSSVCAPPYPSNCVPLNIGGAPYIVSQPLSNSGCDSSFCDTFHVRATGATNIITWWHNGNISPTAGNQTAYSVVGPAQAYTDYYFVICPVTLNDSGTYWATLNNGCAMDSTIFVHLNVNQRPHPTILANGPISFCGGSGVILSANTAPGYSFQWSRNNIAIPGATSASYTATSTGNYTETTTDANSCTNTSTFIAVNATALPTPVASATGNTTFCDGGTVSLHTSVVNGYFYQWQISSGSTYTNLTGAQAVTNAYTASVSGNYHVVVSNSNNCTSTSNAIPVTVISLPPDSVTTSGPTSLCAGDQVNLIAPFGSLFTYQWQQGGVSIPGETNFSYSANTAGQYSVVISSSGCTSISSTVSVTVTPLPPALILTPVTDPAIICADKNVVINANSGSNYTYTWKLNGNVIAGQNTSSYTTSTAGNYTVVVSNAGCSSTSSPFTVIVNALPTPTISRVGNVLTAVGVYTFYQWSRNSVLINGANSQSYTALQDGNYTVQVLDSLTGCYGNSLPFNLSDLSTSTINGNNADVHVYPNPATKLIYIEAPYKVNVTISAVDGKTVIEKQNAKSVDISELANGVYMLRITNEEGVVVTVEKLVKNDF